MPQSAALVKTRQQYRENLENQTNPYEQVFGDSGEEKLPFNRKKRHKRKFGPLPVFIVVLGINLKPVDKYPVQLTQEPACFIDRLTRKEGTAN